MEGFAQNACQGEAAKLASHMRSLEQKQILKQCHLASMQQGLPGIGILRDSAVVIQGGIIKWCGPEAKVPEEYANWPSKNLGGRWLLPALVDCHTHLVFGGNRLAEFEQRLTGVGYEQIAASGGGILSTVRATRQAGFDELLAMSTLRLMQMSDFGVGTVEIKSGYGLDTDNEIKMLRVARALQVQTGVRVRTSFLGAHALPEEFLGRSDVYVDMVVAEMLPEIALLGLVDAVDVFCENIGFTLLQTRKIFEKATELDLPVRLHAEQLSNNHGAALAAEFGALSCDHLEFLDEAGAEAMSRAETVAVLLPGAFYFLNETKRPPVELLRKHDVPMAVATDCNPGSSPTTSLPLMVNMACTLFALTVDEALLGVTRHAAKALGLQDKVGQIAPGFVADIVAWDFEHPAQLAYGFGAVPDCERV